MCRGSTIGVVGVLVAGLGLTGCLPSLSLLQRAETEAPGHYQLSASAGTYLLPETRTTGGTTSSWLAPAPDLAVGARFGLAPRLDVGIKAYTTGPGLVADAKLEAIRGARVILSVDPGLGVASLGAVSAGGTTTGAGALYLYVPVLLGIHLGPDELILSPRVIGGLLVFGNASSGAWLAGAAAALDVPAGPVHLLPQLEVTCAVAGSAPCVAYLALGVSLHH